MVMTKFIFMGLCGLLYVLGLLFGWNYQETSVYVCIYLWPILCILSTLPIIYYNIKKIVVKGKGYIALLFSFLYNYSYIIVFTCVLQHYSLIETPIGKNSINIVFNQCYQDLIQIASTCNTTYEIVNLVIYVLLFLIIMFVNTLIPLKLKKSINKYARKKLHL